MKILRMEAPITERVVLGHLIRHPRAELLLDADCFASSLRRSLWQARCTLEERGAAITYETIAVVAIGEPEPGALGAAHHYVWDEIIAIIGCGVEPEPRVIAGARWLRELARRRHMRRALVNALDRVVRMPVDDVCRLLVTDLDSLTCYDLDDDAQVAA